MPPNHSESLPRTIHPIFLPPVDLDDFPQGVNPFMQMHNTIIHSLPSLRHELKSLSSCTSVAALVVDPLAHYAIDVAKQLNISPYIFFPSNAMSLSLLFTFPMIDEMVSTSNELWAVQEPFKIPGCTPIPGRDLPEPVQNRSHESYKVFLHVAKRMRLAEGIIINSFDDLEVGAIRALKENLGDNDKDKPDVYAVGPIIQPELATPVEGSKSCLDWLDEQPPQSVLFVSFGSGGTLSQVQMDELAFGLELSGQRFLWVVRAPRDLPNAAYFGAQKEDPIKFLPKGFLERTKDRGFFVPFWAPQVQILSHKSTGGFLTHCGWSSSLESIVYGVPLIVWPLFAEQRMNAIILTDDLGVALRPRANEKGIVEREEVGKVVKSLSEGKQGELIRKRMEDLKESAAQAVSKDGTSTKAFAKVAHKWRKLACI